MSTAPQPQKSVQFGERLRRERELRGINLDEIAESTKISKRNLQALEDEHFDQLPGGIFNKGFVRAYAKYLGIDEEQAVNDFLSASANYDQPAALQPPPTTVVRPPVMPSDASIARMQRMWALIALLALVAGLAMWYQLDRESKARANNANSSGSGSAASTQNQRGKSNAADSSGNSASANSSSSNSSSVDSKSANSATQSSPVQSGAAQNSSPSGANAGNSNAAAGNSAAPANNSSAAPGAAPGSNNAAGTGAQQSGGASGASDSNGAYTAEAGKKILVNVLAKEQSWISASAGGKTVLNVVLQPGESRQFKTAHDLTLKTGNAAGIEVTFNGKRLPALGGEKQVKSVTFTAAQ